MIRIYGLKNCDTVKRARAWVKAEGIACEFHDFRVDGLDATLLARWVDELGVEILLNRRGTSWRRISDRDKENLDHDGVIRLMLSEPALIRRPVFDLGPKRLVGFDPAVQAALKSLGSMAM